MQIQKATEDMSTVVQNITLDAIDKIYPNYYPEGALKFFKIHHSEKNIKNDIDKGHVYLLYENFKPIGTITITDNHITRLFILQDYQHKGYGRGLLDFAEKKIANKFKEILIESSLPAKHIYLKRGYVDINYHTIKTENGDYVCYDEMLKKL